MKKATSQPSAFAPPCMNLRLCFTELVSGDVGLGEPFGKNARSC